MQQELRHRLPTIVERPKIRAFNPERLANHSAAGTDTRAVCAQNEALCSIAAGE